jgi:hypothetical protein
VNIEYGPPGDLAGFFFLAEISAPDAAHCEAGEQPAQPNLSGIMPVQNVDNHSG